MLILLSSTSAARYRQDVLRCLAAPVKSVVQFRYRRSLVSDQLLTRIDNKQLSGSALVCFLNSTGSDLFSIVPVRCVEVCDVRSHGSTISMGLEIREVACAEPGEFTREIDLIAGGANPRLKDGDTVGKYCFEVPDKLTSLRFGSKVEEWEKTIEYVRSQQAFQEEPFFWTVLGVEKPGMVLDTRTFSPWPTKALTDEAFSILIYHYQVSAAPVPTSRLNVIYGKALLNMGPNELTIDSRYDLKRWRFRSTGRTSFVTDTWLAIRMAGTWELDLPLQLAGSFWPNVAKSVVVGFLIAIPSILAWAPQKDLTIYMKLFMGALSVLAGIAAAVAVIFGIEKVS